MKPRFEALAFGSQGARYDLEKGPFVQTDRTLFVGFPREVVQPLVGGRSRVIGSLAEVGADVKDVFLAMSADPARSRSAFVANPHEKDLMARGEPLPFDFESVVFPNGLNDDETADTRYNLLSSPNVRVSCINTAWSALAVQRWIDTAINHKPNRGRVGIFGLGNIGKTAFNTMIASATTLSRHGLDSPLKGVNLFHDPHPGYKARVLEGQHIRNVSNVGIKTFEPGQTDEFFRESDIVLFIVSRGIPPVEIRDPSIDVRMVQFDSNMRELRGYIRAAERAGFRGTFVVVSDPPEHLATAVHADLAERANSGMSIDEALGKHQVVAEAGMINTARAEYVLDSMDDGGQGELLANFRKNGYVFGPHGKGMVVANDVRRGEFDARLSDRASAETAVQNYRVRERGELPYLAPGTNLGLAAMDMLEGNSLPISLGVDGVVSGLRAKLHPDLGIFEVEPFRNVDPKLVVRVKNAVNMVASTTAVASGRADVKSQMPLRPTAFWSNGVVTGDALITSATPRCSGKDITGFDAAIVNRHHFPIAQGRFYLPEDKELKSLINDTMNLLGPDFSYNLSGEKDAAVKTPGEEMIQANRLVAGAGIVTLKRIQSPNQFHIDQYKSQFPLFLGVDLELDSSSAVELIEQMRAEGGVLLGFTPRTHAASPMVHFGFFGRRVSVDREFPTFPLRSSMVGFEAAMKVIENWRQMFDVVKAKVAEGYDVPADNVGRYVAPSFRDQVIFEGKEFVNEDPLLATLLNGNALYPEIQSMYEHIFYVVETAGQLVEILNLRNVLDPKMVERMAALHDLGKAVYLRLTHFVNALKLQQGLCGDAIRPLTESELGDNATRWKYGAFVQDLIDGNKIEIPESLKPFEKFIDPVTGAIEKDIEISKDILTRNFNCDIQLKDKDLYDNLMRFFDNDDTFDLGDLYTLVTELADNLSDYGRLNNLGDILKYLGYKEAYALKRYGSREDIREEIKCKFRNLREAVVALYESRNLNS